MYDFTDQHFNRSEREHEEREAAAAERDHAIAQRETLIREQLADEQSGVDVNTALLDHDCTEESVSELYLILRKAADTTVSEEQLGRMVRSHLDRMVTAAASDAVDRDARRSA